MAERNGAERNWPNLAAMFFDQARRRGDRPFLWAKHDGTYRPIAWREAAAQVEALARGLRALGLQRGDRVALVAENRPEWIVADLAIISAGCITVPAYTTHQVEDHRYLLANSGARAAIVSTAMLAQRVIRAADQVDGVEHIVMLEEPGQAQTSGTEVLRVADVVEHGRAAGGDVAAWVAELAPDDLACLIYTSGTGGLPKGVMTSHANIMSNCRGAFALLELLGIEEDEVFLNFLPLSHSYEHTAGMMFPIYIGAAIYFAEGAETLAANMIEARPTIMTAVPRLYETMHQRLVRMVDREGGWKAKLFYRAVALGEKRLADPRSLTMWERLIDRALEKLVRDKMRARFGGRLKAMVSGGAPLNPKIGSFFIALGLRLLQGYGQTETSPVVSANRPDKIKVATVGPPLDGVEVRIAEDGEILVRGPVVMKGYWNEPEATAKALADGWLHTGDVGEIDRDGYIVITDRKRDFIKNSGGDMIAPARIEGALTLEPQIAQAMVYGDRRPYLVAVIVPAQELIDRAKGDEAGLQKAVAAVVGRVNPGLANIERVRRFIVAREPFTTANGQMTPTLKIRRHEIRAAYGAALDALYEAKSS
ncbi:MAG TPA: long-chain fatty acid--CoA ligase [Stellaceae bacterium]|nr:long-chain fatty acid--CoA ligase [Stellaceae bacterium]